MLNDLSIKYGSDKGDARHGYTKYYEKHFYNIRHEVGSVFEMGVDRGASIKMWLDYFSNSKVSGLDPFFDSNVKYKKEVYAIDNSRFKCFEGMQGDYDTLRKISEEFGDFDIIIDDASHQAKDECESLSFLFPYMKSNGTYVIEDLKCKRPNNEPSMQSIIKNYKKTGKFEASWISKEKSKKIEDSIKTCDIYDNQIVFLVKK